MQRRALESLQDEAHVSCVRVPPRQTLATCLTTRGAASSGHTTSRAKRCWRATWRTPLSAHVSSPCMATAANGCTRGLTTSRGSQGRAGPFPQTKTQMRAGEGPSPGKRPRSTRAGSGRWRDLHRTRRVHCRAGRGRPDTRPSSRGRRSRSGTGRSLEGRRRCLSSGRACLHRLDTQIRTPARNNRNRRCTPRRPRDERGESARKPRLCHLSISHAPSTARVHSRHFQSAAGGALARHAPIAPPLAHAAGQRRGRGQRVQEARALGASGLAMSSAEGLASRLGRIQQGPVCVKVSRQPGDARMERQ